MDFLKICTLVLICALVMLMLSRTEKELTLIISATIYIILMIYAITRFHTLFELLPGIFNEMNFSEIDILLKISGMVIISSISIYVCDSVGQKGLAAVIETLCVIEVMIMAFPILKDLFFKTLNLIGE